MSKVREIVDIINREYDKWEDLYITNSLSDFCEILGCKVQSFGNVAKELGWGREFKSI